MEKDGFELKLIEIVASHLNLDISNSTDYMSLRHRVWFQDDPSARNPLDPITYMERYYTIKYTWFVPRAESQTHLSSLTRVFTLNTWVCILLTMVVVSLSLKILNVPISSGYSEHILNTCSVFLSVPVNRMPRHDRLRTVFFAWVLFSLFFMTVFQAFITSFFTDPGKHHQIDTNEELENSNLNLSFIRQIGALNCWKLFVANRSEFILFKNRSTMFRYFLNFPNFAVLTSEEMVMYNLRFLGELNNSVYFHKFSGDVINIHKTLNMDNTSPFVPLINTVIKRLVEAEELLMKLLRVWLIHPDTGNDLDLELAFWLTSSLYLFSIRFHVLFT
ncbi:hypothetical protein L9F63_010571 [Diploptera punctata]|uniref:Ionotropic glutamate receptor C-terminal domain-containing protein n=1 Tax=Diploptera punctata TaxID=6984 RepID=A0AAD8ERD6_DIPPU|nr:hypothetical protein L9F63_010571 [Diploptera punctata]